MQLHGIVQQMLSIIANMLLIGMWFITSYPMNGPQWFISMLLFQHMVLLHTTKQCKHIERDSMHVIFPHVTLTMILSTILCIVLNFVVAAMNTTSPGFLMFHTGILCGLWCKEKTIEINEKNDSNLRDKIQMKWAMCTDISTSLLFLWSYVSTVLQATFRINYHANFITQIYGLPLMITMIISSTLDGGKSSMSKTCRHDLMKFLGKISLSLHLMHYPLILCFCVMLQCIAPNLLELTEYEKLPGGTMPWWGVFIMVPISLLAAYVLERYVETPCRNFLRSSRRPKNTLSYKENSATEVAPLLNSDDA